MQHQYELISFALCPYVQRAVIALKLKKAEFKITYIDLANRPAWFTEISPLGKVPVLKIDHQHVIFESAVISELLDETIEPRFHPADPIARAKERAWMEFCSSFNMDMYVMMREKNPEAATILKNKFYEKLVKLEPVISAAGPYFRGTDFSLVDATIAPVFLRLSLIPAFYENSPLKDFPKIKAWADQLIKMSEVQESVLPTFKEDYLNYMRGLEGALYAG